MTELLTTFTVLWCAMAFSLVALLIHRAIAGIHEEDQIFLDRAEAALESESRLAVRRIRHIDVAVKWLALATGIVTLLLASVWVYKGLFMI